MFRYVNDYLIVLEEDAFYMKHAIVSSKRMEVD